MATVGYKVLTMQGLEQGDLLERELNRLAQDGYEVVTAVSLFGQHSLILRRDLPLGST